MIDYEALRDTYLDELLRREEDVRVAREHLKQLKKEAARELKLKPSQLNEELKKHRLL